MYERGLNNAGARSSRRAPNCAMPHTLHLSTENRTVTAEKILIATGGWPSLPEIPGIEHAITSNEAFHLPQLPRRSWSWAAAISRVEFAGIFHGLGVETTTGLSRGGNLARLRRWISAPCCAGNGEERGMEVRVNCQSRKDRKARRRIRCVTLEDGVAIETDCVMYATGRKPNIAGLGLDAAGVAVKSSRARSPSMHIRTPMWKISGRWAM